MKIIADMRIEIDKIGRRCRFLNIGSVECINALHFFLKKIKINKNVMVFPGKMLYNNMIKMGK